ncbi:MAG: L-2-hydroxyglutarate oxidase [Leptospiraceae bacterium]|nr:L-2-hydroxyglutarate oxidase [Leptospiraceae bacterium]
MKQSFDFIIAGAGIIGTTISLELKQKFPSSKILIIEKEKTPAYHSSGRNSGVLHAGFYYTSDSLKAKFCRDGNLALTNYAKEKKCKIIECGKLVVTKNEEELQSLETLVNRGNENKIEIYKITEKEAKELDPRAKTYQHALYSPRTSVVDPTEILISLQKDAKDLGIGLLFETEFKNKTKDGILTSKGEFSTLHFINSGGLYADKIANKYGFSKDYTILPFKGLYLYSSESPGAFKKHIYPVPNLNNPFLGVHHTITVNNTSKIGPTAIPAFWRENYEGFDRFKINEFTSIISKEMQLFFKANFNFRSLALEEIKKYSRKYLVSKSSELAEGVELKNYVKWGKPGIRAQLLHKKTNSLVMDFLIEGDKNSTHVLNAVSPAFTCSMPFSKYIVEKIENNLRA